MLSHNWRTDIFVCIGAGLQTAEAAQLTGVWLAARCASMEYLGMSIARQPHCLAMLALIGVLFRALACASLFLINRDRQK